MLRKIICSTLLLTFNPIFLSSCDPLQKDALTGQFAAAENKTISNQNQSRTYGILKDTYKKSHITINFPQIVDLHDANKEKSINTMMKNEALKVLNYYSQEEKDLTLEINYVIKWKSTNLLSIQYSGLGNVKGTAHPNHHFYTTNIRIDKGTRLRLKDLVKINEGFVEKVKKESIALNAEHNGVLERFTNLDLIHLFNNADSLDTIGTENQSDTFSYLTKDSLGISLGVSHAEGDHAEFEVKYQDIGKMLDN